MQQPAGISETGLRVINTFAAGILLGEDVGQLLNYYWKTSSFCWWGLKNISLITVSHKEIVTVELTQFLRTIILKLITFKGYEVVFLFTL